MNCRQSLLKLIELVLALFFLVGCSTPAPITTPSPVPSPMNTPTSTPNPTNTPTPTLSPAQRVQTICLKVEQSYPQIGGNFSLPIDETVRRILVDGLGLQVVAERTSCDATLTIALIGEPLGATYSGASGECYTGAEVNGEMTFSFPEQEPLTLLISNKRSPKSGFILQCPRRDEAPLDREVWQGAVLDGLAELWGPRVLVRASVDKDEGMSGAADQKLWEIEPEAIPDLIQILEDQSADMRRGAARSLGAAYVFGRVGEGDEDEVVSVLIQALQDKSADVRGAAALALGEIGPEEGVISALIQTLEDKDAAARRGAAYGLGFIGPEAEIAVPQLTKALEDPDQEVRWAAEHALKEITGDD